MRGKRVEFVIDYKILTMHLKEKKKVSYWLVTNTPQWYGLNENVSA